MGGGGGRVGEGGIGRGGWGILAKDAASEEHEDRSTALTEAKRDVKRGSAERTSLKGRERVIAKPKRRKDENGSSSTQETKGRERVIVNPRDKRTRKGHRQPKKQKDEKGSSSTQKTNTGTVSTATLGKHLRDGVVRIWAFPNAEIASKLN